MDQSHQESVHLASEEVAAYLARELDQGPQSRVEGHLSRCALCRAEVAEVAEVVRSAGPRRTRYTSAAVVAAAAIAAIVLIQSPSDVVPPDGILRDAPQTRAESETRLDVVTPSNGESVLLDSLRFTWRQAGPGALYRFTLTRANGDVLWTESTPDTVLPLTSEAGVRRGEAYFWYVDALLPEGRTTTTGTYLFRTQR